MMPSTTAVEPNMPATAEPGQNHAALADMDSDALLASLDTLPEREALHYYAMLSPKLQWLARCRATGQRRAALIVHHALASAQCR